MKISDLEKISNPDEVKRKFLKYKGGEYEACGTAENRAPIP